MVNAAVENLLNESQVSVVIDRVIPCLTHYFQIRLFSLTLCFIFHEIGREFYISLISQLMSDEPKKTVQQNAIKELRVFNDDLMVFIPDAINIRCSRRISLAFPRSGHSAVGAYLPSIWPGFDLYPIHTN